MQWASVRVDNFWFPLTISAPVIQLILGWGVNSVVCCRKDGTSTLGVLGSWVSDADVRMAQGLFALKDTCDFYVNLYAMFFLPSPLMYTV